MHKARIFQKSDERILGNSEFVEKVLSISKEQMESKYVLQSSGVTSDQIAQIVAELMDIEKEAIYMPGKRRDRVQARSLLCYLSVKELDVSMTDLSRQLKLSLSTVSLPVTRGEKICAKEKYSLTDLLKLQI